MSPEHRLYLWVSRGRGGILGDGVKLFRKPPVARTTPDTDTVMWEDPDDRVMQPNTLHVPLGEFYQWFGFTPEEGECRLFETTLRRLA